MRIYRKDIEIQQNACKILSNIAINSDHVGGIVRVKGIECIKKTLDTHTDPAVIWLACSALWNIAQRREFRDVIGLSGIKLIFRVIRSNKVHALVQETALGALANLSVNARFKEFIGASVHLPLLYAVMRRHHSDARVQTSLCGLLTNLAHREQLSARIGATG
eukprot:867872_1